MRALIAWFVDDLRGLAGPSGGFYGPAIRGSCLQCQLDATRIGCLNTTVWVSAIKCTEHGSTQRAAFKQWYEKNPDLAAHADMSKPARVTKAFALRKSLRCMQDCVEARNESHIKEILQKAYWREVDIWSELLPYWDRILQNINDPAHEIANMVKQLILYIGNDGAGQMKKGRAAVARGLD